MILDLLAWAMGLLAVAGIAYTLAAARAVGRLRTAPVPHGRAEATTLLKPLHGDEPRLADNLAGFLRQRWDAPVEMVAGVSDAADPAAAYARALGATLVVDATRHGDNGKVSNLVNMEPAIRHDLVVLSDSDMSVPPDYLAVVAGALAAPGVGAATCLYRGRADAGGWSLLAAAGISYQFLPAVTLGVATGLASPCMGSTIAFRRATLDAIGGFRAFADRLADDYAIGEAIRAKGLAIAVPPMVLTHGCAERSAAALWRHERRWATTIRRVDPRGYVGMAFTYPFAWSVLAAAAAPRAGAALLLAAFGARLVAKAAVDRTVGASSAPAWLLPVRDMLSFAIWGAGFAGGHVDWRGRRLTLLDEGRIAAERSSPA